jgi:hypothetical protein
LIAELETRVEQLRASEVDIKNLFYREKEAREVLEYDYKQLAYSAIGTWSFGLPRIVILSTATNPYRS